jgi:hypothetical protein
LLVNERALTALVLIVSGLALLVPAFIMRNPFTVVLPGAVLLAGLVSLSQFRRSTETRQFTVSVRAPLVPLLAIWFGLVSVAVLLYTINGYSRSLAINGVLLCLYVLPMGVVFFTEQYRFVLAWLLGAGLLHRALIYFANPLPYGIDPHFHYGHAANIASQGTIETLVGTKELFAPFYHVGGAMGSVVLGLPVRQGAVFLALIVPVTLVTTLVVYHLTAAFWDRQAGLLAVGLLVAGDHTTGRVIEFATTEFAFLFFAVVVYAVLWYVRTQSKQYLVVFFAAMVAINFTHHATMFVASLTVVTFSLVVMILYAVSRRFINLSVLSILLLFFNWLSMSLANDAGSFFIWITLNFVTRVQLLWELEGGFAPRDFGYISAAPMASTGYLSVIGLGLLFFFAVFGTLYWMSVRRDETRATVLLIGGGITFLVAMMFAGSVGGIDSFVPSRWFKHLYVLLAILGGVGLIGLLSLLPENRRTPTLLLAGLLVLLVPYVVFMGGSLNSSIDDPIFDEEPGAERMAYTDEEVATVTHSMEYVTSDTTVVSDQLGWSPFRWDRSEDAPRRHRMTVNLNGNRVLPHPERPTMVVNREYMYTKHPRFDIWATEFGTQRPLTVRGEVPFDQSSFDGYGKVYQAEDGDCGETRCGVYLHEPS